MSAQHTTGSWHYAAKPSDDETCPEFLILCGPGYIATVDSSRDENAANARLIAAAPDLLFHLEGAVDALEAFGVKGVPIDQMKTAIAKARGNS